MKNKKNNEWTISDIIIIAIAFSIFWPLGIFLILRKLGLFEGASKKKADSVSDRSLRLKKYKIMMSGRSAESIDYLAAAVGIPFDLCMADLQQMVANEDFGAGAYINYADRMLVLSSTAGVKKSSGTSSKTTAPKTSTAKKTSSKKTSSKKKEKKPYGALTVWLLIAGIMLLLIGVTSFTDAIDMFSYFGLDSYVLRDLLYGIFYTIGGGASLFARNSLKKRTARFGAYSAAVIGLDYIKLDELAKKTGVKKATLRRDLAAMIDKDLLGDEAYIDVGADMLVLKAGAVPPEKTEAPAPDDSEDKYKAIIREIRELNDAIPDPDVSDRIDKMEDYTSRIFAAVKEKPEKLPQIKSFMSYYLPTTLKLLRSYADFDQSGLNGENVQSAKRDIERILDTLVEGFSKQLDKLYETDAMDISSDIDVLETMLKKDGLTGDGSNFGSVSGKSAASAGGTAAQGSTASSN